jgi:hypothetical protein
MKLPALRTEGCRRRRAVAWLPLGGRRDGRRVGGLDARRGTGTLLMADDIPNHNQRGKEHCNSENSAAKSRLAISGKPLSGGPQVAMRCMSTIGVPAYQSTHNQDEYHKHGSG